MSAIISCSLIYVIYITVQWHTCCVAANQRIAVTAPVNPVDNGQILSIHCQVWNLLKGQEVTILRNRTHGGSVERLSLDNVIHKVDDNVFIAERQLQDGSVVYFLSIVGATRSDEGEYFCKVSSVFGRSETLSSVGITFTYFPADTDPICNPSGSRTVHEDTDALFDCSSAIGNPRVTVEWRRAGSTEILNNMKTIVVDGRLHVIYRLRPTRQDSGAVYTCTIRSVLFPKEERSCHVGPIEVIYDNMSPPININTEIPRHILSQFTEEPFTQSADNVVIDDTNDAQTCDDLCPVTSPGSPVHFWIIATVAAGLLTIVFLIVGIVLTVKYYRLSKTEFMAPTPPASRIPHRSEEIYVEVDGKRREHYMYMSLEKSSHPVLQPVNVTS